MDADRFDEFEMQVAALERSMSGTVNVAASFESEITRMKSTFADTGREAAQLSRGMSYGLKNAFEGLVFEGDSLGETLSSLAMSVTKTAYNTAVSPIFKSLGGMLGEGVGGIMNGLLPFAAGGAFTQGRVMPFADGGIVRQATAFPMRGGTGLMGEAGPEAIMPLSRGADGKLGVRAEAGRPVQVVMNVTTQDAASFDRSRAQIAAQMARAIGYGQRNR